MIFNLHLLLALGQVIQNTGASDVASFSPDVGHKTFVTVNETNSSVSRVVNLAKLSPIEAAHMFVKSKLGFNPDDYIVKNSYVSDHNKITHIYLRQTMDNKEIFNADINLNVSEDGEIISYGDSFYRVDKSKDSIVPAKAKFPSKVIPATEAMESFMEYLKIKKDAPVVESAEQLKSSESLKLKNVPGVQQDVKAVQGWIQSEDGTLEPVWDFEVELKEDYYHGHVSALTKKTVSLHNWCSKISYTVVPFGRNDIRFGGRYSIVDPQNNTGSSIGWHDFGTSKTSDTAGNNVIAVTVPKGNPNELNPSSRVSWDNDMSFNFTANLTDEPKSYLNASVTNLFYMNNMLHDLYYLYGFDEKSGNFQENNFGKGGRGSDAVIAHAQDSTGKNNAFFFTPPDGTRPHMQMFIYDVLNPNRDSDFDNGIIIHEYTHGLSNRLTGGSFNADCLGFGESASLGEGWGDFFATMFRMNSQTPPQASFGFGEFVLGRNYRIFPHSTSRGVNPTSFDFLGRNEFQEVHNAGEIWAEVLFEIYWIFRYALPYSDNWFVNSSDIKNYANTLFLRIVIDGMKIQPCRPTFLNARDAILTAERYNTQEKYKCAIWSGFAKRGMGINAAVVFNQGQRVYKNSFDVPPECRR